MSKLNGYILHQRPYRETSLLLDLFSLELGKVSVVAKGVKGNKSDRKSLLQAFQPLTLELYGRSQLRNLGQVEGAGQAHSLAGEYLFCAMYLNELLNRTLTTDIPYTSLFAYYQRALQQLVTQCPMEEVLREFEFTLLESLGFALDCTLECNGEREIQPEHWYCFNRELGFEHIVNNGQKGQFFQGEHLLQIGQHQWNKQSLSQAKQLTRIALQPLLGNKPLKSRELFLGVKSDG